MIRLPKLFNRNSKPEPVGRVAVGSRARVAPKSGTYQRSSQTSSGDDLALTEDPDRQRARHRLIGAAVLVLLAVVGLPRILDGKPKAVNSDIVVNIVTSLPLLGSTSSGASSGTSAVNSPAADPLPIPAPLDKAAAAAPPAIAFANPPPATEIKTESKGDAVTSSTSSAAVKNLGLSAGEEVIKPSATNPNNKAAVVAPNTTELAASSASETRINGSKFVIQIGAFASEERVKGWIGKLKEQKIPNYVLNKTGADGTKLYVLRAGPFTDKDAAEAAEKKIKALGLSPRIVEVGKT